MTATLQGIEKKLNLLCEGHTLDMDICKMLPSSLNKTFGGGGGGVDIALSRKKRNQISFVFFF